MTNPGFPIDSAITVELIKRIRGGNGISVWIFIALLIGFMYTNTSAFSINRPNFNGPMPAPGEFPNFRRDPFQPPSARPGSNPSSLRSTRVRYSPVGPTIVDAHPNEISITNPPPEAPYLEPDKPDLAGPPQFGAHTKPPQIKQDNWSPLSRSEKRKTEDRRDCIIYSPRQWLFGFPKLRNGFRQILYKTGPHGAVHGCEYSVTSRGTTYTGPTEENAMIVMDSLNNMPLRKEISWYFGVYQEGTNKSFDAVFLYDPQTRVIAVYSLDDVYAPGDSVNDIADFVTTCQLNDVEEKRLFATGNFGGGPEWFNKGKNSPPPYD